jgi:hypothetical protein
MHILVTSASGANGSGYGHASSKSSLAAVAGRYLRARWSMLGQR